MVQKTILHSPENGLPILYTKPGFRKYSLFISENKEKFKFTFPTEMNEASNANNFNMKNDLNFESEAHKEQPTLSTLMKMTKEVYG